jgi:FixJ family two-component response regulator
MCPFGSPGAVDTVHVLAQATADLQAHRAVLEGAGYPSVGYEDPMALIAALVHRPGALCVIEDMGDRPGGPSPLLRDLVDHGIAVPVLLIAGDTPVRDVVRALQAGVIDFLVRPVVAEELVAAVSRTAPLADLLRQPDPLPAMVPERLAALTSRERQVLSLLVRGLSAKETGLALEISPRTVEIHRRRILRKMQATNVVQLTRMVMAGVRPYRALPDGDPDEPTAP